MASMTNSALIAVIASLCAATCNASSSELLANQSFAGYMAAFGRTYAEGSSEHRMREALFSERMQEIRAHNVAGRSWKMGLNEFTDWTADELVSLRGYRTQHRGDGMPSSIVQLGDNDHGDVTPAEKPAGQTETLDWTTQLATSTDIISQGACGSCWAVAAAATIQLHAAKSNPGKFSKVLSPENINKCAPNPMECGGQGGCQGSTPKLAFDYVANLGEKGGLYPMDKMPYTASTGGTIPEASCNSAGSFLQVKSFRAQPAVSITGVETIEPNNAAKVMDALVKEGPLAVAVVGEGIQGYSSGVLDNCNNNVIDHAVVMMGFGTDTASGMKYWTIRNSWGKGWGENGFFRLQRHYANGDSKAQEPCGWDNDPAKGVACKDAKGQYPEKTWVCGECGIISDVTYPTGVKVSSGLLGAAP